MNGLVWPAPLAVEKGLTASKLSKAIAETLHNAALAPNAQKLGERLSAEDGVSAAVEAILSRLA